MTLALFNGPDTITIIHGPNQHCRVMTCTPAISLSEVSNFLKLLWSLCKNVSEFINFITSKYPITQQLQICVCCY